MHLCFYAWKLTGRSIIGETECKHKRRERIISASTVIGSLHPVDMCRWKSLIQARIHQNLRAVHSQESKALGRAHHPRLHTIAKLPRHVFCYEEFILPCPFQGSRPCFVAIPSWKGN